MRTLSDHEEDAAWRQRRRRDWLHTAPALGHSLLIAVEAKHAVGLDLTQERKGLMVKNLIPIGCDTLTNLLHFYGLQLLQV